MSSPMGGVIPDQDELLLEPQTLMKRYDTLRRATEYLCEPLEPEDYVIQTMEDVSPTKWHLAHTTWFFEHFVLKAANPSYEEYHPLYHYLFNSYYVSAGERFARPRRGMLSRPTVTEVMEYRKYVDRQLTKWLLSVNPKTFRQYAPLIELGIQHEQQHGNCID